MADEKSKIEEIERLTGVEKDKYEEVEKYLQRISKKEREYTDTVKERLKELKKELGLIQEIAAVSEHNKKRREEEKKILQERAETEKNILERSKANLELLKLQYEEMKKNKDIKVEELDTQLELIKGQEQQIKNLETTNKQLDEQVKKVKEVRDHIGKVINAGTGGLAGKLLTPISSVGNALSAISDAAFEVITREKEFASTLGVSSKQINVDLFRMGEGVAGVKTQLQNLGAYGIDIKNIGESFKSLYTSMSGFSKLDTVTQMNISRHTSLMKNFGISAEAVGKNYDILTKSLRMSGTQVTDFSDRLMRHAQAAGIAPKKMVEEFAAAAPKLVAYGKRAEEVYINLQKAAKSLGMEMSSLTNILGDQFDTFEGSARAAGRLNAILGGNYLNSVEMLNASEDERLMLIKQAMDASGKQFDSMEKYEKKAVAAVLGINDLSEANKLFGVSTSEVEKDMNKQASSQKELMDAFKAAADPMGKLSSTLDNLRLTLKPFADDFNEFLSNLAGGKYTAMIREFTRGLATDFGDLLTKVIIGIALIGPAFDLLIDLIKGGVKAAVRGIGNLLKKMLGLSKASNAASGAASTVGESMANAGTKASSSASSMLAFGAAVLMVGAGIAIAAYGLTQLVLAFAQLDAEKQASALMAIGMVLGGVFLIGLLAVIAAAYVGWAPLLAVGAAFFLIGAGIGLAAWGMSKLVSAFKDLNPAQQAGAMTVLSGAMIAFGIGLGIAAAAALWGAPALAAVSVELLIIGVAVGIVTVALGYLAGKLGDMFEKMARGGEGAQKFGTAFSNLLNTLTIEKILLFGKFGSVVDDIGDSAEDFSRAMQPFSVMNTLTDAKIDKFTKFFESLNGLMWNTNLQTASMALTEAIESISKSVETIPENKKIAIESVIDTVNRASTITPDQIKPAHDFVLAMTNYHLAQAGSKTASDDAVVQALRESTKSIVGELKEGRGQSNNVNINVNGGGGGGDSFSERLSNFIHGFARG